MRNSTSKNSTCFIPEGNIYFIFFSPKLQKTSTAVQQILASAEYHPKKSAMLERTILQRLTTVTARKELGTGLQPPQSTILFSFVHNRSISIHTTDFVLKQSCKTVQVQVQDSLLRCGWPASYNTVYVRVQSTAILYSTEGREGLPS